MTTNVHEARARTAKAYALAQAAKRHARRMTGATPADLADAAARMDYRWWLEMAEVEGIRRPSVPTVAAAVALLAAEAEAAATRPSDDDLFRAAGSLR